MSTSSDGGAGGSTGSPKLTGSRTRIPYDANLSSINQMVAALQRAPDEAARAALLRVFQDELLTALEAAFAARRAAGSAEAGLALYAKVLKEVPGAAAGPVAAAFAAACVASGETRHAVSLYRHALAAAPSLGYARDTLRSLLVRGYMFVRLVICNGAGVQAQTVSRWHFAMINDAVRNEAYRVAIAAAVKAAAANARGSLAEEPVLDIGAGTGLLAMMASEAGAGTVFAVEASPAMAAVARETLAVNRKAFGVRLMQAASTTMTAASPLPAAEVALLSDTHAAAAGCCYSATSFAAEVGGAAGPQLPTRARIIVSEVLDAGLLGEGAMRTLRHAILHLLAAPPTGDDAAAADARYALGLWRVPQAGSAQTVAQPRPVCIPAAATVWIQPIICPSIAAAAVLDPRPEAHGGVDVSALLRAASVGLCTAAPYTTEQLGCLPHTALAAPAAAASLAMCPSVLPTVPANGGLVETVLRPEYHRVAGDSSPIPILHVLQGSPSATLQLTAQSAGRLDAIALWFDLHLDAARANTITTAPASHSRGLPVSAWDQAVYYVRPRQGQGQSPRMVAAGDVLTFRLTFGDTLLEVEVDEDVETAVVGAEAEAPLKSVMIPENAMRCLNDSDYNRAYAAAIAAWMRRRLELPAGDVSSQADYTAGLLQPSSASSASASAAFRRRTGRRVRFSISMDSRPSSAHSEDSERLDDFGELSRTATPTGGSAGSAANGPESASGAAAVAGVSPVAFGVDRTPGSDGAFRPRVEVPRSLFASPAVIRILDTSDGVVLTPLWAWQALNQLYAEADKEGSTIRVIRPRPAIEIHLAGLSEPDVYGPLILKLCETAGMPPESVVIHAVPRMGSVSTSVNNGSSHGPRYDRYDSATASAPSLGSLIPSIGAALRRSAHPLPSTTGRNSGKRQSRVDGDRIITSILSPESQGSSSSTADDRADVSMRAFDLLVASPFDVVGPLKQRALEDIQAARSFLLRPPGRPSVVGVGLGRNDGWDIIPASIAVRGQLATCSDLARFVRVSDAATGSFSVDPISIYASDMHYDVEPATMPHAALTNVFDLLPAISLLAIPEIPELEQLTSPHFRRMESSHTDNGTADGGVNTAITQLSTTRLQTESQQRTAVTAGGTVDALLFWGTSNLASSASAEDSNPIVYDPVASARASTEGTAWRAGAVLLTPARSAGPPSTAAPFAGTASVAGNMSGPGLSKGPGGTRIVAAGATLVTQASIADSVLHVLCSFEKG